MNNLTTRKIVLGLLMALVLTFSLQGNLADALTFKESRTGDVVTLSPNKKEFTIKFSVNLESPDDIFDTTMTPKRQVDEGGVDIINSSGYELELVDNTYYRVISDDVTAGLAGFIDVAGETDRDAVDAAHVDGSTGIGNAVDAAGNKVYKNLTGSTRLRVDPGSPKSDSLQHHYNDEAIGIYLASGSGSLNYLKKGDTDILLEAIPDGRRDPTEDSDVVNFAAVSLIEKTKNRADLDSDRTLTSSVTLKGEVSGPGVYTIKIVDVTHMKDLPW